MASSSSWLNSALHMRSVMRVASLSTAVSVLWRKHKISAEMSHKCGNEPHVSRRGARVHGCMPMKRIATPALIARCEATVTQSFQHYVQSMHNKRCMQCSIQTIQTRQRPHKALYLSMFMSVSRDRLARVALYLFYDSWGFCNGFCK